MSKKIGAVIAAAGSSSRMNGVDKLFEIVGDMPVIARACLAFEANANISDIAVVVKPENVAAVRELLDGCGVSKLKAVVAGGATRSESVKNGVDALSGCDFVAVHDGARPFVSQRLIDLCAETAFAQGSAVPVIPSVDTLKSVDGEIVTGTVDRNGVFRVQTPQVFGYRDYLSAYEKRGNAEYTDDSAMLEAVGFTVHVCEGEAENIKITSPSDLTYARFLAGGDEKVQRTGFGYDVHKLVEGRKLILCGVEIPFEKGLLGHSDADVAAHAVADALLGAAALGDIGRLFPDTDEKYAGADSMKLLRTVVDILSDNGYTISNIDITIVAQRPKLAPFVEKMRENIASVCGCRVDAVGVKATTEEGLGFTGSGEGISASAVCSIVR